MKPSAYLSFNTMVRKFLFLDSVIYASIGLYLYLAPDQIAQLILKRPSTDGVHWHLLRCIGGQMLATASLTWRCSASARPAQLQNSAGAELQTACLLLRLLGNLLSAFVLAHARAMHGDQFEPEIIQPMILLFIASALVYLFMLLISGWQSGNFHGNILVNRRGNIFCQIDSCMAIAIGFGWAMAPLWLLRKQVLVDLDPSHELCGQIIGVNFLSSHIISSHALNLGRPKDRTLVTETRAAMILSINLAQIWSQFAYHEHWSNKHSVGISVFVTWTCMALLNRAYLWWSSRRHHAESEDMHYVQYRHQNQLHHHHQNGTTVPNGNAAMYKKRT